MENMMDSNSTGAQLVWVGMIDRGVNGQSIGRLVRVGMNDGVDDGLIWMMWLQVRLSIGTGGYD